MSQKRAALSNHVRWHPNDLDGHAERRREFVTEKLADFLHRTLADAPPLTDEQVTRLTTLLREAAR